MSPSTELLALLARLGLAAPAEVQAAARRARRLAKGLPLFDRVWVDALAQIGTLTSYQAAEINAGRAERLALGPFTLRRPLTSTPYADVFQAVERQTRHEVRLLVAWLSHADRDASSAQLEELLSAGPRLAEAGIDHVRLGALEECDPHVRLWAAAAAIDGVNVADWMIAQGRLAPAVVLEIARQMAGDLRVLERFGLVHGDLAPASLIFGSDGRVHLPHPGVRAIVRPEEGYGRLDLAPSAYETLSPERIIDASPPDVQSELFACGCLWWHLLSGRSPIAGGDGLAKFNSIRAGRIPDVTRLAPETPPQLAAVISRCLSADPVRRGDTFAELLAQLGPSTRDGRQAIAELVRAFRNPPRSWTTGRRNPRLWRRFAGTSAAIAGCTLALAAVAYPVWFGSAKPSVSEKHEPTEPRTLASARAAAKPIQEPPEQNGQPAAGGVAPAAFQVATDDASDARRPHDAAALDASPKEDVLILDAERPIVADAIELRPGRIVRGREGGRPQIQIDKVGLLVSQSDIRFENIDFICRTSTSHDAPDAMVRLAAARVTFQGCTFQSERGSGESIVAVRCQPGAVTGSTPLPRSVVMERCVLANLSAAVEVEGAVVPAIELKQSLLTDVDMVLRQDVAPLRQPTAVVLTNLTMRRCNFLMSCRFRQLPLRPARIAVTATDCVLAPQQALFQMLGPEPPQPVLRMVQWNGEGSLLEESVAFAIWQTTNHQAAEPLDDAAVAIDGLARSKLEFAGEQPDSPASSRLVKWAAPVGNDAPPGVDAGNLPDLPPLNHSR